MLCLLTFEISEDWDGKNFYTGVHGILVLFMLQMGGNPPFLALFCYRTNDLKFRKDSLMLKLVEDVKSSF